MLNTVVPILDQHNGIAVVSSRIVAEQLSKKHNNVIRDLENILENSNVSSLIIPHSYGIEGQNRSYKEYLLTKDGFILYMFNIQGHNDFKMAYINCFNDMENTIKEICYQVPTNPMQALELMFEVQKETNERVEEVNNDLQDFKNDMPLLGIEEGNITTAVRKKGVSCLEGKTSNAYQDKSIRAKVYADIYRELKRQFGVASYKAIKRNQVETALQVIRNYSLPLTLKSSVESMNV